MTDRDPEGPRKGSRKPSALDQLARFREGLQGGRGSAQGAERLSSSDAIRRARDAFGASDDGRVAPPSFGGRDEPEIAEEDRRAARRDATRIGDADAGEDGSLVRAMLRDIRPSVAGGVRGRERADRDDDAPRRARAALDAPSLGGARAYGGSSVEDRDDDDAASGVGGDERDDDRDFEDRAYDAAYDEPSFSERPYDDRGYDYDEGDDAFGRGRDVEPSFDSSFSDGDDAAPERDRRSRRQRKRDARRLDAPQEPSGRERGPTGFSGRRAKSRGGRPEPDKAPRRDDDFSAREGPILEAAPPPSGRPPAPFGALERMIAGRYLRARRKEGFISVIALLSLIGVTLGVAVLIVVMSVMNGFRSELVGKIVGLDGHMSVQAVERDDASGRLFFATINDYEALSQTLGDVEGVIMAAPVIESPVFVTGNVGEGTGAVVRALPRADFMRIEPVSQSPEESKGLAIDFGARRAVAVGWELAQQLGVDVGDTITILAPTSVSTPFGRSPRRRVFEVLYVYKAGYFQHDSGVIFMPLVDAQDFFGLDAQAESLDIMVATPEDLDSYRADFETVLADSPGAFLIRDWTQSRGGLVDALQTEQTVMFFILSMLILIAALVIISGLIMLVKEKGPDIAILRTMGLTRGGVMRVFFMCGATIGVLGTALGVALGVIVALNIADIKKFIEESFSVELFPNNVYFLSELPSRLDWGDVGFTVALTLGISFLATIYPARRAARMDPVEGLRNG